MLILTSVLPLLQRAWAWLKRDYHWFWLVLFPLGVFYLVAKLTEGKQVFVGSSIVGADAKREEVQQELAAKDAEARDARERVIAGAQQGHSAAVSSLVTEQAAAVAAYEEDEQALNAALLRAGKEIRR